MIKTTITKDDILSLESYEKIRPDFKAKMIQLKNKRRVTLGPYVNFYFENYETMFYQIHEMLRIEKGGDAQIEDELHAYNPLIPNGTELTATLMFEIEDKNKRAALLGQLGGVEEMIYMQIGANRIQAFPEKDQERSKPGGRTASVHFIHFPFDTNLIQAFKNPNTEVYIGIAHTAYGHMSMLNAETREELARDFI
jgi:hypothetical protein